LILTEKNKADNAKGNSELMIKLFALNTEKNCLEWDQFVCSQQISTPFHLSSWIHVIQETYGFEPLICMLREDDETISGAIPCFVVTPFPFGKKIVSLPFSDNGGPLGDNKSVKQLLDWIIASQAQRVKYIEIRGGSWESETWKCHNFYYQHVLKLNADPTVVYKNFEKRTIQYCIRKAQREKVEIIFDNSWQGLEEFIHLNILTRKKHGVPSQPKSFFEAIYKHIISKGNGYVLLAKCENRFIAAGLFIKHNNSIYYKYNASDPGYLAKKTPNHLLTWYAIQKACLEGYDNFNFGRTSKDNMGLCRYKEMWGAFPQELKYFYYPEIMGATTKEGNNYYYRIATKIWKIMPNALAERISPIVMKYIA